MTTTTLMAAEYQRVAAVLADARAEALEERPLSCAAINSVIDRLTAMWGELDPAFDRDAFRAAANYRGMTDGTTGLSFLP
jgi:hypothetical protein